MRRFWTLTLCLSVVLLAMLPVVEADGGADDDDDDDDDYYDTIKQDLDEPLNLAVAMIAMVPLTIASLAYRRTGNQRFLLLSGAFGLFAVKGVLLFFEHNISSLGISAEDAQFQAVILDFFIILLIAMTMLRK